MEIIIPFIIGGFYTIVVFGIGVGLGRDMPKKEDI